MGRGGGKIAKPSGADERAGGFCSADFSGASPVASALGIRSGATPHGRSMARSVHSNASAVASSSTASSTICALRSAASRRAVIASLLTLRGMPLVT